MNHEIPGGACARIRGEQAATRIGSFISPVEFAQGLSFRHDVSARQEFLDLELTPYLRHVLAAADFVGHGHREITIVAPEQTGKSLTWQVSLLWSFLHSPGLSLVVYPSDDKADEVNRAKLLPLMRGIPELAAELDMPKTKAKNRYNFGAFISYFQGSGERISAHAAQIRIADELDDWIEHDGRAAKLDDLRKRGRSFRDSLLMKVSSPKGRKARYGGSSSRVIKATGTCVAWVAGG
jgi:phage terminase large subunit GpA-like protein